METRFGEHDSKIHTVSDQIQLSIPVPQMVLNKQRPAKDEK
jgi:hypothetical protein